MRSYLLPGAYLIDTRLRQPRERISWILTNVLVVAMASMVAASPAPVFPMTFLILVVALLLALVAWQSLYEIGYIQNDIVTTTRETRPTLRHEPESAAALRRQLPRLYALKVGIAGAALLALAGLERVSEVRLEVGTFALALVALGALFMLHNAVRSSANLATFLLLLGAKFAAVPLLFADSEQAGALVAVMMLTVPLIRTLEYAALPRFGLPWLARHMPTAAIARPLYYAVMSLLFGLSWWLGFSDTAALGAVTCLYLLAVRLIALVQDSWLEQLLAVARKPPKFGHRDE